MVDKKRGKLYNRMFFKVYANYAFMVLLFAVVLGSVFLNLSERATTNNLRQQLFEQGRTVSRRYHEFILNKEYDKGRPYLDVLREIGIGAEDIWAVSNPYTAIPMHETLETMDLNTLLNTDNEEYTKVVNGAFQNQETYQESSAIHGIDMIVIGVPVVGENGKVCGALLLNATVRTQSEAIKETKTMIFYSAVVSLIISFILAILFARQLVLPITKMRHTALMLAEKKYETKTGINRKDEIGDLARTIDFLTDKLIENEDVRKNLDQMRLDFFANVSHELRTPITVVRAYTECFVDGVIEDETTKRQYYDKMLLECKSMERLVGDLLLLSKMQNPDFVIEKEPVNVVQIFDDIMRTVKTMGSEKNIGATFHSDQEIQLIHGDYDRLRQMFLVICDNAVKFSPENANIDITIKRKDKIEVIIRDEGIGIAEEELPNIFDKFYKSKLRQNARGSGLGLAIAKQIALKHDGDIHVVSVLGKGTEFVFVFNFIVSEEMI